MKNIRYFSILLSATFAMLMAANAQDDKFADIQETLGLCSGCHGERGASENPEFPILAGQEFYYLYVQLRDFKAGRRANEIMEPLVKNLDRKDMKALAQYFSEQTWPSIPFKATTVLASKGDAATAAGQCVACHLGSYTGNSRVPRLAGQHPEYLQKTMLDFKTKERLNSPAKSSLMVSYTDEDIAAMAAFLANM